MPKILLTVLAAVLAMTVAGCGGGSGSGSANTIHGVVRLPAASLAARLTSRSLRADVSGLAPQGGVTVELVRLDSTGHVVGDPIATAVTDDNGAYSFAGADIPPPDSTLAVVVTLSGQSTLRAIVTGASVDISPVSEAMVQSVLATVGTDTPLGNFSVQELAALRNVLQGMDIDVSGAADFSTAVASILNTAGPVLSDLVAAYAAPAAAVQSVLHNNSYNIAETNLLLEDPYTLGGNAGINGGLILLSGNGGGGFAGDDTLVSQAPVQYIAGIEHSLVIPADESHAAVFQLEDNAISVGGLLHSVSPNGQVVVGDAGGNAVVGAVSDSGGFMVYPMPYPLGTGVTYAGILSRGLRVATMSTANVTNQYQTDNTLLDPNAGGTTYNVVSLTQALHDTTSSQGSGVTVTGATGSVTFDSTVTTYFTDVSTRQYAALSPGGFTSDPLSLDFGSHHLSSGVDAVAGHSPIEGVDGATFGAPYYAVVPGGGVLFQGGVAFMGQGGATVNDGEVVYFNAAPTPVADGLGERSLAIAIRRPASTPIINGTYNVVQYTVYLTGDDTDTAKVDSAYKFGSLTLALGNVSGHLVSQHASLDIPTASGAASNALTATTLPEDVSGSFTRNIDGTVAFTFLAGSDTVTGNGAATADGKLIVLAVKGDNFRGLLFLVRQPNNP